VVTHSDPWTCPTCHTTVSTPYCPGCGERPLRPRELTFRGLLGQLLGALTTVDGRLLRTFRCLIGRPGFLTLAYLQGSDAIATLPASLVHKYAELGTLAPLRTEMPRLVRPVGLLWLRGHSPYTGDPTFAECLEQAAQELFIGT